MRRQALVSLLLVASLTAAACKPVTIKKWDVEPLYACTGERIRFEWDINGIDKLKVPNPHQLFGS